jgi:hypothetical protein
MMNDNESFILLILAVELTSPIFGISTTSLIKQSKLVASLSMRETSLDVQMNYGLKESWLPGDRPVVS